jgi:hypothetical protein
VPEVLGPHPLYGIALRELREDGIDAVTKAAQIGASFGGRVALLAPVRREELDTRTLRQLSLGLGRMVIAVSDGEPAGGLDKLWQYGKFVGIGRSYREAGDEPRPADPDVHPKAVKGLPEQGVLTEGGLSLEPAAAVGTSEQARWQRHRVANGEAAIVRSEREEVSVGARVVAIGTKSARNPSM